MAKLIMATGSRTRTTSHNSASSLGLKCLTLSYFSYAVNSHYGSSSDLLALSEALHARGMYLMVDIVVNNMVCYILYCNPILGVMYLTRRV
jgi:hypothetical protein